MQAIGAGLLLSLPLLAAALFVLSDGSSSRGPGDEAGPGGAVSWTHRIEVATGEAYQGPWRMNTSDFRYVDAPTVALDDDGVATVAWVDQARRDVVLQRYRPDGTATLDAPVNVSRTPDVFSWLPRVVAGPAGSDAVYVLWQEIVFSGGSHGGEIFFARSLDGGRTFGRPLNLSATPAGAGKGRLSRDRWDNGSLDLVLAPDGTLYAAWTEYEGALRVSRSSDGGASFSAPVAVAGGGRRPARGPSLAAGADGVVHLAWTVGEDRSADVRVARSDDGGRSFGEPQVPFPGPGHQDAPKLAVDAHGVVHLVYAESAAGPFGRAAIRYARARPGRPFEAATTLAGPDADGGPGGGFPHLGLDGTGNPYVVWELFPRPGMRPLGLAVAVSPDRGDRFAPAEAVPGSRDPGLGFNASLQGHLARKLAVNPAGEVAVVNGTFLPGRTSRVLLHLGRVTN